MRRMVAYLRLFRDTIWLRGFRGLVALWREMRGGSIVG